jgi:hypothetical protein
MIYKHLSVDEIITIKRGYYFGNDNLVLIRREMLLTYFFFQKRVFLSY